MRDRHLPLIESFHPSLISRSCRHAARSAPRSPPPDSSTPSPRARQTAGTLMLSDSRNCENVPAEGIKENYDDICRPPPLAPRFASCVVRTPHHRAAGMRPPGEANNAFRAVEESGSEPLVQTGSGRPHIITRFAGSGRESLSESQSKKPEQTTGTFSPLFATSCKKKFRICLVETDTLLD